MTRPSRRTARTAGLLAIGVALLLPAAGCDGTTAGTGTPAASGPPGGTAAGTPAPSGTASSDTAPPAASASAPAGPSVAFGPMRVPVPDGGSAKAEGEHLCVTLSGDSGCTLEVIDIGGIRAQGGSVSTPDPGAETGWWTGSDVPSCGNSTTYVEVTRSTPRRSGFAKVGDRTAEYGEWSVTCVKRDLDFAPRVWWLPSSQIVFRQLDSSGDTGAAVDRLLAGVTFG